MTFTAGTKSSSCPQEARAKKRRVRVRPSLSIFVCFSHVNDGHSERQLMAASGSKVQRGAWPLTVTHLWPDNISEPGPICTARWEDPRVFHSPLTCSPALHSMPTELKGPTKRWSSVLMGSRCEGTATHHGCRYKKTKATGPHCRLSPFLLQ